LVESDGPFGTVEGHVGEPKDVVRVVEYLASSWGVTPADVALTLQTNLDRVGGNG
jgi:Tat protein secretion system quality control protein TatD with DNase activity